MACLATAPTPVPVPVASRTPRAVQQDAQAGADGKGSIFFKTVMCRFFKAGKCTKGKACSFAHNKVERKGRPDLGKTKMCPFVSEGVCNDANCTYAHSRDELRKLEPESVKKLAMTHKKGQAAQPKMPRQVPPGLLLPASVPFQAVPAAPVGTKSMDDISLETSAPPSLADGSDSECSDSDVSRKGGFEPVYLTFGQSGTVIATTERPVYVSAPGRADRFDL